LSLHRIVFQSSTSSPALLARTMTSKTNNKNKIQEKRATFASGGICNLTYQFKILEAFAMKNVSRIALSCCVLFFVSALGILPIREEQNSAAGAATGRSGADVSGNCIVISLPFSQRDVGTKEQHLTNKLRPQDMTFKSTRTRRGCQLQVEPMPS